MSWERHCLGLPSAVFVTSANQHLVADALMEARAGYYLKPLMEILNTLNRQPDQYMRYAKNTPEQI